MQIVVYMPWPLYVTDLAYITGFSCMLTHPSPQVLDDGPQLLQQLYHRVAASVMLTDCIQQVYIPLLVYGIQKLAVLIVMLKPTLSQFGAFQNSIPNMQTHEVHPEVKPVSMLSEPFSSLHMLRQMFAGSQVSTRAALSLFASKFPLICTPAWLKTGGNYLQKTHP